MRLARRIVLAVFATVLMSGWARAQVMDQVPANAAVVFKVKNLDATNQKLIDFFKAIGVANDAPPLADPLGFLLSQAKITNGINKAGDMAFVLVDPGPDWNWDKSPLMLVPVSDYQAFIGNFADAKTDANITTASIGGDPQPSYIAHWGDYAAITPNKDNLATAPAGLKVTGASADELDKRDIVILANLAVLKTEVLPALEQARTTAAQGIDQQAGFNPNVGKYGSVLKVVVNQFLNIPKGLFTDSDVISLGLNIDPDGVSGGVIVDFHPDSYMGKVAGQMKNSSDSMLTGLPASTYLFMGGAQADPKVSAQVISDFMDPILAEVTKIGPEAQPLADYLGAFKDIIGNESGSTFAMLQPQGELGSSPLIQFITIAHGDSKVLVAAQEKLTTTQGELTKMFGAPSPMKITMTPGAKTVGGVNFDQIHIQMDPAMANAMPPQAQMVVNMMYGQDGMNGYIGAIDDQTSVNVAGASDDYLASAVTAVKGNDTSVGQLAGITNTASHLPKERAGVFYVAVDTLVNTVLGDAAKFGFPINADFPASDPVGITFATQGTALREDVYVPTKTIASVVDIIKKLQNRGGPGGPPGGGPGGGAGSPPPGGL